jgi:hypothetical protein
MSEEAIPNVENTESYNCDKCEKTFKSAFLLKRHQLTHKDSPADKKPAPKRRVVRSKAPRKNLAPYISKAALPVSMMLAQVNQPTATALSVSSASIAKGVDQLIAGTSIDKSLQPLIAKGEVWGDLIWGITFPVLIFAITQQPILAENEVVKDMANTALDHIIVASLELQAEAGPTVAERMTKISEKLKLTDDDVMKMKQTILDNIFGNINSQNDQYTEQPEAQTASVE